MYLKYMRLRKWPNFCRILSTRGPYTDPRKPQPLTYVILCTNPLCSISAMTAVFSSESIAIFIQVCYKWPQIDNFDHYCQRNFQKKLKMGVSHFFVVIYELILQHTRSLRHIFGVVVDVVGGRPRQGRINGKRVRKRKSIKRRRLWLKEE